MKALAISDARQLERFASQQVYYSLHSRDIESEIVPACIDQGVGVLVWSPLAGGLLSGKYRRGVDAPAGSRHLTTWSEPPVHDEDKLYATIETAVTIGEAHGVSVGARTTEQLADDLAASDLKLSEGDLTALDECSGEPLRYPFWHQANTASDRLGAADLSLIGRRQASG
jgi:aryl-alcohol dehydrogenase-like predicted oxidoreductase